MGSKRSSFPARILKKYNKARAIMGKRSDATNDDEASKGYGGVRWMSYLNRAK